MSTKHHLASEWLTAPRQAWIHASASGEAKDCLLFLDGELYTERVKASERIRVAQAAGTLPALDCVYLSSVNATNRQMENICNESFASFLSVDVPRWIERTMGRYQRLFLCGLSLSALQAVFTALRFPSVFAGVLSQSPSAWWRDEWLVGSMTSAGAKASRFWLSVGTSEVQENVFHPPTPLIQKTSQLASVRRLAKRMTEAGHEVHCHEYDGGHDPACWNAELPQALAWLLHAPRTSR
jgi:enterochelin esterase family protein